MTETTTRVRSIETDRLGDPASLATLDEATDVAVTRADEALRRRVLLQAVDWTTVTPDRVQRMLARLSEAGRPIPHWLAKALLLARHGLPVEIADQLPGSYRALNRINHTSADTAAALSLDDAVAASRDGIDPDIARAIVAGLIARSQPDQACRIALAAWPHAPEALAPARPLLRNHVASMPEVRIRLAGFSTTDTLAAHLVAAFAACGWRADVAQSDFGAAVPTLLAPAADADCHIVLLDLESLSTANWRADITAALAGFRAQADLLVEAIAGYAGRADVPLLVNALPYPAAPTLGHIDRHHASGLRHLVDGVNERLHEAARMTGQVHIVDADQALVDIAPSRRTDPKQWYYGRIAYSEEASRALAAAFASRWTQVRRGPAKVLALDLDDTLWGGVYGEDGIERLACGDAFPGSAFLAFQQECLRLRRQGMLLVALSKNNPDAITVFERHSGMLLKPADFAASAINWDPKPENVRRLAAELNLGLDSFVFLDDSPHEREAMRRLAPEVEVPELPADPAQRPGWLRRLQRTWPVRLTDEDARRADLYNAGGQARALRAAALTPEAYLAGLEQRMAVAAVDADTLARVAQMHQRTNQFNLTTRRLTEADVRSYIEDPARGLAMLGRVADRFGDHGIVIAATASIDGRDAEIVTFLMSCRVIGREVEQAFLGAVLDELARRGVRRVAGRYIPTAKNVPARDFYEKNGFALVERSDESSIWMLELDGRELPHSAFVTIALEK